jgi:hypothetical protein
MRRLRRNPYIYVSGAFGAIWVFMAWSTPDNNYFMFPMLIAAAVPVSYRLIAGRALPVGIAMGASIAGILNVFLLTAMLAIAGKLEGPTMLPVGGVVVDAILLGLIGAALGTLLASVNLSRR